MDDLKTKFVPVNLAYKLYEPSNGQEDRTPVIFSHSFSVCKEYWSEFPQIVAEQTNRKVYNVDARHHGESDWEGSFYFDANVDDLVHFMDTHKIQKAILVGHSMGGITSYKVALRHPSRVEKVCAVESPLSNRFSLAASKDGFVKLFEVVRAALEAASQATSDEEAHKLYFQYFQENGCEYLKSTMRADNSMGRYRAESLRRNQSGQYRYPFNFDALMECRIEGRRWDDFVGRYEGPVLIVVGGKSYIPVREFESETKSFLPGARFEVIEDANHDIPLENIPEFEQILLKFLSED